VVLVLALILIHYRDKIMKMIGHNSTNWTSTLDKLNWKEVLFMVIVTFIGGIVAGLFYIV
jgi:hypothetical protein